jgi:AGZA family xanthine/uracil permease-like MFS transporter
MFERLFRLKQNGTTARTEVLAGLTTFLTMAYIIFLQPAILSGMMSPDPTKMEYMDFGAVMTATCVAAAVGSILMGLWARYPIAQAPGMGENFFFLTVMAAAGGLAAVKTGETTEWQVALGVVFIAGVLFLILSLLGIQRTVLETISPSMRNAIAVGIGIFIAFIGLTKAGLIEASPGTCVTLNPRFASPDLIVFFFGLLATAGLHARRVRGSIVLGILAATVLAIVLKISLFPSAPTSQPPPACVGQVAGAADDGPSDGVDSSELGGSDAASATAPKPSPESAGADREMKSEQGHAPKSALEKEFEIVAPLQIMSLPPPVWGTTLLKMDLVQALNWTMIPFILIFLFMDLFDTLGTMVGVSEQAGLIGEDGKLPRLRQAMTSDAIGTVAGAALGTSTVTSFIESTAGVEQGGRTGLTAVTTGCLFLVAMFFAPLVKMIGAYPPITTPALVIVGSMMMWNVTKIEWSDFTEALPAFLIVIGIPLTFSIANGLALGFLAYPLVKLLAGRGREVKWLMYVMAVVLAVYFALLNTGT